MSLIKKNTVSTNLWDYNIGLIGESGIGKTTVMTQVCEKLVGEDGYVVFNTGKEDGVQCLEGVPYIDVPDYETFNYAIQEIIKNKDTEYRDLKIIIVDTLDQLFEATEPYAVKLWNAKNKGKEKFVPAETLNGAWGGFGKGEDKVIELILDKMWKLKKKGIAFWFCGHTRTKENIDPITGTSYSSLTTNMMNRAFNGVKSKFPVVGIACIDREIAVEKTGRKNIVNKQDITINRVKSETRKIVFRDDNYSVDSKSRFSGIVDEIPLDADEFIKALQDAITKEKDKGKKKTPSPIKSETKPNNIELGVVEENITKQIDDISLEDNSNTYPDNLKDEVGTLFKACTNSETKKQIRNLFAERNVKLATASDKDLKEAYDILTNEC